MKEKFQITQSAELTSLSKFRKFIRSACLANQILDLPTQYDLQLAMDEACTNIITHGYAGMNPGSIILEMEFTSNKISMEITDFGHPFEPVETSAPDLDAIMQDIPTQGFGLFFIYQAMENVDYETTAYGNHLRLSKNIKDH